MKARELRELTDDELRRRLLDEQKHLFDLRTQAETEKLEKPTEVTRTKREIARILTVLRERERAAGASGGGRKAGVEK